MTRSRRFDRPIDVPTSCGASVRHPVAPRLRTVAVVLAFLLASGPALPAVAAEDEADASRPDQIADELDVLEQSDVELQGRLTELDGEIARQQAVVADAEAAREAAEDDVAELMTEVDAAQARADEQLDLIRARAVEAYVRPRGDVLDALVRSGEYTEFHERTVLLSQVAEHDEALLEEYRLAEDELEGQRHLAEEARTRAEQAEAEAEDGLERVRTARDEQEVVRAALQDKIAEFRAEADAFAAQEAALAAVIDSQTEATAPSGDEASASGGGGAATEEGPLPEPPAPPPSAAPTTTAPSSGGGGSTTQPPATQPPTTQAPPTGGMTWPCNGVLTSPFGFRWGRMHNGIDIGAPTGTTIRAAQSGRVYFAGWMNGYGNTVLIDHGGGMTTLYAHQSSIAVGSGTQVSRGQTIGYVGSTGNSTGPHLHFEVRVGGTPRDPLGYLP